MDAAGWATVDAGYDVLPGNEFSERARSPRSGVATDMVFGADEERCRTSRNPEFPKREGM